MQITKRTERFSLGREAKFELNSLAPGFSFGFDQIILQEEKLLLKTREVKEARGKYQSGCEAEIKSWMRRAAGTTAMKISRQWYSKMKVFSRDTKVAKVVSRIYHEYFLTRGSEIGKSLEITMLSPGDLSFRPGLQGPSITRKRDRTKSP